MMCSPASSSSTHNDWFNPSNKSTMPCTFYDWISNLPPTPSWKDSRLAVDISSLNFADSPYLTLTSSPPANKQIKIDRFFMEKNVRSGLLHLEVEISFYRCAGTSFPAGLVYSLGSMPLTDWDHCNNKFLHFLAVLIEYIFQDMYKISHAPIVDFLARSDVLELTDLFSSAFMAACIIAHRKENLNGMLQFPEDELEEAITRSKIDFLTALGDDDVDEFMLMVASIFTEDYYNGIPDDQAQAVMNPFSFSKRMKSNPCSWMIRAYTPVLLMDFMRRGKESREQAKNEWLHYALTQNNLQAVFQLCHTVEIFSDCIQVQIRIQNMQCDLIPLSSDHQETEKEMKDLGIKNERHFPSQILLTITPLVDQRSNILEFSRAKSSKDPGTSSFDSAQTMGIKNCNWKFQQTRERTKNIGILEWVLYDNGTGNKVVSMTEPSIDNKNLNRLKRKYAWFRDVQCSSSKNKVGVVFTDDCEQSVFTWRVKRDLEGQTLRWLLCGFIWLTYWPIESDTSYSETICHEFCQHIEFKLVVT